MSISSLRCGIMIVVLGLWPSMAYMAYFGSFLACDFRPVYSGNFEYRHCVYRVTYLNSVTLRNRIKKNF
jgi:hypothetical protein